MFDLRGSDFPSDPETLRQELEAAVRRRVALPEGQRPVILEAPEWPQGRRLAVDLSGGRLELPADADQLRAHARRELKPPAIASDRRPGPIFEEFEVRGEPVNVGPMQCRLLLSGRDVRFDFGRDADGTVVMAPADGHGELAASVPKAQFLDFIRRQAIESAQQKGFEMEQVELALASQGDRSIAISGTMAGRKKIGFVSPRLAMEFTAELEVDDDLVGHLTKLELQGQGMVLDALLALLRPKVAQIKAKPIPIRQLLGNFVPAALEVRDAAISIDDEIRLSATFGSAAGEGGTS